MGTISENFSYSEFEASDVAAVMGMANEITSAQVRNAVRALVVNVLQPLRDRCGTPLKINSGFRCPELNKAVGGAPASQHLIGEAADIAFAEPYRLALMVLELGLPFDQMILYPSFLHISHKKSGVQRRMVLYSRTYEGLKL
ncbi:MAG: peptidase M15 [Bacteroidales bacterium]|nr:peptidase M15 [Bacteroidales bacterium]